MQLAAGTLVTLAVLASSLAAHQRPNPAAPNGAAPGRPAAAAGLPPSPAATLTAFTDRVPWLAAAGGATTLVTFEGIPSGTQITNQLAPFGIASTSGTTTNGTGGPVAQFVTSSAALPFPMFVAGTLPSEPNFLSNSLTPAGGYASGDLTLHFSSPQTAVAAFVADQSPLGGMRIEVYSGAASLGFVVLPARPLPNSFSGLVSDVPFTSARFAPENQFDSWGLDDLEFSGTSATPFCFGDGTGTPCPCANHSPVGAGAGYLSSLGVGAVLQATGAASVAFDSFVLQGSGMPNGPALYFQGTGALNGGLGLLFGDGLRCVGGTLVRLGTRTNAGGASQYPAAGDTPISVAGALAPGAVRRYQVWYRNAAAFCTPDTYNLTNGFEVTWL